MLLRQRAGTSQIGNNYTRTNVAWQLSAHCNITKYLYSNRMSNKLYPTKIYNSKSGYHYRYPILHTYLRIIVNYTLRIDLGFDNLMVYFD